MSRILFLVHRIPFPPNKGDKIRSFNILKQLARKHEVYLGAFIDDEADWQHEAALKEWCVEHYLRPLRPGLQKLRSLRGLASGEPLTVPYYRDVMMGRWVRAKLKHDRIDTVVAFSSAMAQYVMEPEMEGLRKVVDLVDVDSEKWRAYAPRHRWPMNWVYQREAVALLRFEREVASTCDATVLVSPDEAALFERLAPESKGKIYSVSNGVDTEYFSPDHRFESPYEADERVLVFTGAMDYWANVDAVTWFAESIFPKIRARNAGTVFYIVGTRPSDAVRKLENMPGVRVTGAVPDVRPYLAHAYASVAPLRIARGIQNKVLEAMAMAKPVLGTSAAMEGIRIPPELRESVCDEPHQFVERAVSILAGDGSREAGALGRRIVLESYSWEERLAGLDRLLTTGDTRRAACEAVAPSGTRGSIS